jgi:iron complex transport system ATP-binding protein
MLSNDWKSSIGWTDRGPDQRRQDAKRDFRARQSNARLCHSPAPLPGERLKMNTSIVRVAQAGHGYDAQQWQFRKLDLDLRPGEILAILGPNGRGKSTLLRAMAGLISLTGGNVETSAPIGFVPQDFGESFPYSVLDIVLMGRARHIPLFRNPTKADEAIAMDALTATAMASYATRNSNTLSGGEKQLVLIARALAGENTVLLLDEPASALDLKNQDRVLALMHDLAIDQNLAIAFTTHQPNHALAIADHVLMMLEDTQAILGSAEEVLIDVNLQALYGIPVRSVTFEHVGIERTSIVPLFRERGWQRMPGGPTEGNDNADR